MTSSTIARELSHRLPSDRERTAANHLRHVLAAQAVDGRDQTIGVVDGSGTRAEITLTAPLSRLLIELLRHIGRGDGVTLVPVSQMLTTQQAADILNVSRPFLIGLLERGGLPYALVGRHRRIRAEDLFAYQRRRDEERAAALTELAEGDADLI